jgi:CO dehydrogenase maturation factor
MLLIVSDPGARGLRTIARIKEIATQLGLEPGRIQIVFNRFKSGTAPVDIGNDIPIAIIPDDPLIEAADLAATPVSQIPFDSPARVAVLNLAKKIQKRAHERDEKPE